MTSPEAPPWTSLNRPLGRVSAVRLARLQSLQAGFLLQKVSQGGLVHPGS